MLDKAKEYDKKHIWLSVLHSNERAINFYIKNDFKQVGKHSFAIAPLLPSSGIHLENATLI